MDVYIRAQVEVAAELRIFFPHDFAADDGVDFDACDIAAAGGECPRDVPATPGADDESFRAGPQIVRERGSLMQEIVRSLGER